MSQPTEQERESVLRDLERWLDAPMMVLAWVWLGLLLVELVRGLTPILETATTMVWAVFVFEFAVRLGLATKKRAFLRRNWLTALSLLAPGLRLLRAARLLRVGRATTALRLTRGARLLKIVGSINRSMTVLGRTLARRHFKFVLALTTVVTLVGAAGMLAFERTPDGEQRLDGYGTALWWTAMVMTTMGSELWPRTPEGRLLCVLLALYSFTVFGYVTATLASFFLGQDRARDAAAQADEVGRLREQVEALRRELASRRSSASEPDKSPGDSGR